ncbi:MFS transporter [Pseudonocardiaceae bacterium YIM PH 21723]|nr:MFS transporter [Pseudonocardiaceae bacterium YIM PH 21723]
MFVSLRYRNYRLFASGQIISLLGVWMSRIAQDWLVLDLSHGSPLALGIMITLQFAPTLLLSLWAGVLADRVDKRKLLVVLETAIGVVALLLGLLVVTGVAQLWQVYVISFVFGAFTAIEVPTRQAFITEMVGREQLSNAVALNSMIFNTARIVGPAIAGAVIAWVGTGPVFLINAATFIAVIAGLLLMDEAKLFREPPVAKKRGQLLEGLRYVAGRPDITLVMTTLFFVSTFALNFQQFLPVVAREVFKIGSTGYGVLASVFACGTLLGATLAARRSARGMPSTRLVMAAALVFSALTTLTGLVWDPWAFGVLLIPTGVAAMTFMTAANTTVQLNTDGAFRGRVMSLYFLVFIGGTPLGSPIMGWIAEHWGGQAPIWVGGLLSLLSVLASLLVRRLWKGNPKKVLASSSEVRLT